VSETSNATALEMLRAHGYDPDRAETLGAFTFIPHAELDPVTIEKMKEDVRGKAAAEKRRHLLARMAGNIVGAIMPRSTGALPGTADRSQFALVAIDIAEAILAELERRYPP
jgi:hypothetical protein